VVEATDEELMQRYQRGDESAFDQLVLRYGPALKGFAARVTSRPDEAEDIYVETFSRVVEAADRWRPTGSFRSYLFTIAWRICLDSSRRRGRQRRAMDTLRGEPHPPSVAAPPPDPESLAAIEQRRRRLEAGIAELPERHRAAVLLTYRMGLSSPEVAEILGWSSQEVRSKLAYARRLLKQHLQAEGYGHGASGGPHAG